MRVTEFRNSLNDDIIGRYEKSIEIYENNIEFVHKEIKRNGFQDDKHRRLILYLKTNLNKKKQVEKVISVLKRKRRLAKDVFSYTEQAKYKVVGNENHQIYKMLEYQSHLFEELDSCEQSLAILEMTKKDILDDLKRSLMIKRISKQRKHIERVQKHHRDSIMEVVDCEGVENFSLTVVKIDNEPNNKNWFLRGLTTFRIMIDENNYHLNETPEKRLIKK